MAAGETLRCWLSEARLQPGDRLPPERSLCDLLGLSRGDLRKALAALEDEQAIRRHVGRGTFMAGEVPAIAPRGAVSVADLSPVDVARARLFLEPHLGRCAALHATAGEIGRIRAAALDGRAAHTWGACELADDRFHAAIAAASGSAALLHMHDRLREDSSRVAFGRLIPRPEAPSPADPLHADHLAIADRIASRDMAGAADAARDHVRREYPFLPGP